MPTCPALRAATAAPPLCTARGTNALRTAPFLRSDRGGCAASDRSGVEQPVRLFKYPLRMFNIVGMFL